jgi:Amt family ammonium transporter
LCIALAAWLPAWAAAGEEPALNMADTAWMLTATVLVLFMTIPGLSLFYAGMVRAKNVLSVLMQCFTITCMVSIVWILAAYGLAFGDGGAVNAWIGGLEKAFMRGIGIDALKGTIPETVFAMFQLTFAIITPALVVGGFAERMRFSAMMLFVLLWLLAVYVPICHWVWGEGWLQELGLMDFAGGTVVHINAGVAALVAALVLGRRRGFPETPMPPHNLGMTVAGACMLWVGWFGFNAGSALAADGTAGMTMLVTHIGAAAGSLGWMFSEWLRYGKPSVLGIVTGMVAGLGTITPASGFVGPMGALVIGATAGVACFFATTYMKRRLHVDDSLDVFPVHGVGGMIGTTLTGVFAATYLGGVGYAEGVTMGTQVLTQLAGIGATIAWCAAATFVVLKVVDIVVGLRVSAEEETQGLDTVLHNETGYNF